MPLWTAPSARHIRETNQRDSEPKEAVADIRREARTTQDIVTPRLSASVRTDAVSESRLYESNGTVSRVNEDSQTAPCCHLATCEQIEQHSLLTTSIHTDVASSSSDTSINQMNNHAKNFQLQPNRLSMFQTINHAQIIWNNKSKSSGILGGHLNVRSLLQKLPQIEILLSGSNLDFLGISETWLNATVCSDILNIEGYDVFRKDRQDGRKGGGVLLFMKSTLTVTAMELATPLECVGVEVRLSPEMSFNVINVYRPPDANQEFYLHFEELLKAVADKESIILGDFNVDWKSKNKRKKLKFILNKVGFKQLIDCPTRITEKSQTIIDLVIANHPLRISKCYSLTTGMCFADHNLVLMHRKLHHRIVKHPQKISYIPKSAIAAIDDDIASTNWDSLFSLCEADRIAEGLTNTLSTIIQSYSKTTVITHKTRRYPWITDHIRKLMKKRDKALKQYLKTKSIVDQVNFKQLRNKILTLTRSSKANYFLQQSKQAKGNPKKLWKIIENLTGRDNNKDKITLSIEGSLITKDDDIANKFSEHFANIVSEPSTSSLVQNKNSTMRDLNTPINQGGWTINTVTVLEVANIIKHLSSTPTKDYYGIHSVLLQRNLVTLARPMCMLVNQSIVEGIFPSALKLAYITPIHKSGCKMDFKNYRPVSILPTISKIIEKAVTHQMTEYLERNHLLSPSQYGFRKKYSTESACVHLTEFLRRHIDRGGVVGAVFLDLRKAFDMISHERLLNKLQKFEFAATTIDWIRSYLGSRAQCVKINNAYSNFKKYPKGVPQGSNISPILFTMFINDLPNVCPEVHTQMYADDTAIFYHGKDPEEVAGVLSNAMKSISLWLAENQLSLNVDKTVAIYFGKKELPNPPQILVEGTPLNIVRSVKYLGVHFDSTLKFKTHIQNLSKAINITLGTFNHIRNSFSHEAAVAFYHAMITSRFTYCITCWSQAPTTSLKLMESLHKRAAKILDKKPRDYHHCRAYSNNGLLNLGNQIKYSNLVLVHRILYDSASPTLREYVQLIANNTERFTRACQNLDCKIPPRSSTFGQASMSVRGIATWNGLPRHLKAITSTKLFSQQLKKFLLENQVCQCF